MTFSIACVGIVIILLILISTSFMGIVCCDDDNSGFIMAWILSSIGFGVCLTALLVQNGIV